MKFKVLIFLVTFLVSFAAYNFKMMIYTDDNRIVKMTDVTQEQNDILKNEMEVSQFNTLRIKSVNHAAVWGNDIERSFQLMITISEDQKDAFLWHIEKSDNFVYTEEISDIEMVITYRVIGGSKVEEFVRKEGVYNSFTEVYLIGLSWIILLNCLIFIPYRKIFSYFTFNGE